MNQCPVCNNPALGLRQRFTARALRCANCNVPLRFNLMASLFAAALVFIVILEALLHYGVTVFSVIIAVVSLGGFAGFLTIAPLERR